jgi:hypothetical protein
MLFLLFGELLEVLVVGFELLFVEELKSLDLANESVLELGLLILRLYLLVL